MVFRDGKPSDHADVMIGTFRAGRYL